MRPLFVKDMRKKYTVNIFFLLIFFIFLYFYIYQEYRSNSSLNIEILENLEKQPDTSAQAVQPELIGANEKENQDLDVEQEVQIFLSDWASHWSNKNLEGYFNSYDKNFLPESTPDFSSWMSERKARIKSKNKIKVTLTDIYIISSNEAGVEVNFQQLYEADAIRSISKKYMLLTRKDGVIKIIKEYSR